ncbi:uncharacterized protein LOC132204765 [Neocloeon triangulifer]|uniref:uncharacterized protein LOC132204765 n=1 Tax=Neocloeon triangulifer TaxID=2078957 RepID=UPI00286F779B|nr:uncharacterized protein LOC132204765 [Neocloeon triangulifer]XP_059489501.1 uncharacterized protein LOC132204765 [Neocloeon triangulifer]XP_059489502.1 uncharacterized protein LOC132204765 [Neocloeon triangulifer]
MMVLRVLLVAWACAAAVPVEPSTSPNSAVMPSVSFLDLPFGWNHSSQEKDIAAVFQRAAYGSTTPSVPPPTPPTTPRRPPPPPPRPITPAPRRPTSSTEAPVTRGRLKHPLPPEYLNPFADKPILRGSLSEGSHGGHKRPPPVPPKGPPEQERIPIRPPDLPLKHKPLNTPARGGSGGKEGSNSGGQRHSDPHNETEINFVPILQNPAVTRILSGSNGRKEPDDRPTRLLLDLNKMFPMEHPTTSTTSTTTPPPPPPETDLPEEYQPEEEEEEPSEVPDVDNDLNNDLRPDQRPEDERLTQGDDYDLRVWGVAWDVHVYLMGGLFLVLVLVCLITWLRRGGGRVLSPLYLHLSNGLLLTVGVGRAIFLLHDAYNLHRAYPESLAPILLHFALPLLCLTFALLFLFVARFTRTQLLSLRRPALVAAAAGAVLLVVTCLGLQLAAGLVAQPTAKRLLLINEWLLLVWAVALALAYLAAFPLLSRSLSTLNPMFSTTQHVPPASLGLVLRSLLAVAMLLLLLVCVHLYGVFGVAGLFGEQPPRPWPWWGFHFSVRVIEVSISLLMAFVAALRVPSPSKKAFKDPSRDCSQDLYPAVCGANYAVQKKLYEDPYQLRTLVAPPPPPVTMAVPHLVEPQTDRPSSMLFAEDGFVRFRTSADPEQPMEEVLHRTMSRNGGMGHPVGLPGPRPPIPQPRWAHCHHPSDSDFTDESSPSSSSSSGGSRHPRGPSEDVSPDSAVGSDIYSKNGDIMWRDELLSRSILDRLAALHQHAGYAPLAFPGHPLASPTSAHYNLYARPDDESAV